MNLDSRSFAGFTPDAPEYLRALAANNRKEWFEGHRDDFADLLQKPLLQLAAALAGPLLAVDPDLVTIPGRVVSRIHRDTRFSRDKSPYKTTMWLTFKRPLKEWRDAPAFFFEIAPAFYRYGMGFYGASKDTMDRLREVIDRRPDEFRQAVAFLAGEGRFVPEGEQYRRMLKDDLPADLRDWYQRKNLYLVCCRSIDDRLFGRGLAGDLRDGFNLLAPFYEYLRKVKLGRTSNFW